MVCILFSFSLIPFPRPSAKPEKPMMKFPPKWYKTETEPMKLLQNICCHHESNCLHDLLSLHSQSIQELKIFSSAPATVPEFSRPETTLWMEMRRHLALCNTWLYRFLTLGCLVPPLSQREHGEPASFLFWSLPLSITRTGQKIIRRTDNAVRFHFSIIFVHFSLFFPIWWITSHSSMQTMPR